MTPKTIVKRRVVTKSISSDEGLRCVDIFRREDNSFGFEEYRKDKETYEGWYKVHSYGYNVYLTEQEALTSAYNNVSWLKEKASNID